jgi:DNA primase
MDKYQQLREVPFPTVIEALGFAAADYIKTGQNWRGRCPSHLPKKNRTSFQYREDGAFNCFACDLKGKGAIDLVKLVRGIGFQEAVELLGGLDAKTQAVQSSAKGIGRSSQETSEPGIFNPATENPPKKFTYEKYYQRSEWLSARGVAPETLERYGVGEYNNPARQSPYKGKILIRIQRFSDGATVAYLSRNIGDVTPEQPKYRFPANFHKSLELFGAWQLKEQSPVRVLYVVESAFSVMHFHQLGFPCVALMGWSVSPQQAEIIGQLAKGIVFLPDQDKREEAKQYIPLLAEKCWVRYPVMPKPDPEHLAHEEIKSLTL